MPVNSEPTFHQQARREQLVDLAIELIGEHGLAAASTSAIARRAGVSRGVVNYNVGDRDALMRLVIARVYALGTDAVGPAVTAAPDPRASLRAFVVASLKFYAERPAQTRALREIFADHELLDRAGTAEHQREVDDVATIIRAGQQAGQFAKVEASLAVAVIRAALDWAASKVAAGSDAARQGEEVLALIDRAVGALEPGPTSP